MPKTKSRSDLEITYSYAKNKIVGNHLGMEEGKMVANHTHFKKIIKETRVQHAPIWA
jgi:hypothetical protein